MAGEIFSSLTTSVNPNAMNAGSRNGVAIDRIILHHNATTNKDVAMNTWLASGSAGTSAHYEITDTEIIGCVGEQYAAWHAGGTGPNDPPKIANPNYRSIGLENVNSSGAPSWAVSEATHINCAKLVADICTRYGMPCDRQHVLKHSEVTSTACPGGLNVDKVVQLAQEFQKGDLFTPIQPEKEEPKKQEDEDMIYAFANRNAIFYVQGPKVSVLHSEADWNAMQAIYSQTHDGKQIKVFDWMDNNSTADAVFRTLGYYEDEAFRNSVTEGIDNIKKNLK
ncbi:peptidoglycan recognition protein family protein [Enterococcus alishanensis]